MIGTQTAAHYLNTSRSMSRETLFFHPSSGRMDGEEGYYYHLDFEEVQTRVVFTNHLGVHAEGVPPRKYDSRVNGEDKLVVRMASIVG